MLRLITVGLVVGLLGIPHPASAICIIVSIADLTDDTDFAD